MDNDIDQDNLPKHIAIIMDGNRRWAKRECLTTPQGHKAGADNIRKIAKFANSIGIKYMTLYAFSTENWKRSKDEVEAIMKLFKNNIIDYLTSDNDNIKVKFIGIREGLSKDLYDGIVKTEEKSKNNTGMVLNIAFNYGGRREITRAAKNIAEQVKEGKLDLEDINEEVLADNMYTAGQDDPDLLIRTSGEERISNFLLWQIAYTEFYFTNRYWPEFNSDDLLEAIRTYQQRNRKFGGK